jgi:hypothetical protein
MPNSAPDANWFAKFLAPPKNTLAVSELKVRPYLAPLLAKTEADNAAEAAFLTKDVIVPSPLSERLL